MDNACIALLASDMSVRSLRPATTAAHRALMPFGLCDSRQVRCQRTVLGTGAAKNICLITSYGLLAGAIPAYSTNCSGNLKRPS